MSEDIGDPTITIKQTYSWKFATQLVPSGWGRIRYLINAVSVSIERDPLYPDSDYLKVSCYGVEAKKNGTQDGRSRWDWYAYPGEQFTAPYVTRAKALWRAVHGDFREEPDE